MKPSPSFLLLFSLLLFTNSLQSQNSSVESRKSLQREIRITDQEFERIEEFILQDFKDLEDYIKVICDRNTPRSTALEVINTTINYLFMSENSKVHVSNIITNTLQVYKVRQYFFNLMNKLPYDKIIFDWMDVHFIEVLRRRPDGKYDGLISVTQRFSGFSDNRLIYSDTTTKNVKIVVEIFIDQETGDYGYDFKIENIGIKVITDSEKS